LQHIE
jgi:hypothetical protein